MSHLKIRIITYIGILHILLGILLNPMLLAWIITPDGVIDPPALRIMVMSLSLGALGTGILLLMLRRRIKLENILLLAGTVLVCLVLGETILAIVGYQPRKTPPHAIPNLAAYWATDSLHGCYVVRDHHPDSLDYNQAGFRDTDEFTSEAVDTNAFRILLLGDSYAFGHSAIGSGRCFAEVVEDELNLQGKVQLWNTGIPGIGQKQELYSLKKYVPILKPQLVILAFVMNDFVNNSYPMGKYYAYEDGKWIDRYRIDPSTGEVETLSPAETYARACFPRYFAGYLELSRLYCLFTDAVDKTCKTINRILGRINAELMPEDLETTCKLIAEIRDFTIQYKSQLLVLIVPERIDLIGPGENYNAILNFLKELDISYIEVRDKLGKDDYAPDGHWNVDGHYKVGMILVEKSSSLRAKRSNLLVH